MPKITHSRGPTHKRVDNLDAAEPVQAAAAEPDATGSELERPAQSALKADWVAYAEAQGVDTDGLTKDQIIEAVD